MRNIVGVPTWHSDFHEYAYEAGPGHVAFAIDGNVVANFSNQKGAVYYDKRYYLIVNTALGGEWPKPPSNSTEWPALHILDRVAVVRAVQQAGV